MNILSDLLLALGLCSFEFFMHNLYTSCWEFGPVFRKVTQCMMLIPIYTFCTFTFMNMGSQCEMKQFTKLRMVVRFLNFNPDLQKIV